LNELTPDLEANIAPTDSRLRPDQRALENAQYKLASDEKFRLEEKQRAARKVICIYIFFFCERKLIFWIYIEERNVWRELLSVLV
jgi:hypothetical protein